MTYNVFGVTLNLAQSSPIYEVPTFRAVAINDSQTTSHCSQQFPRLWLCYTDICTYCRGRHTKLHILTCVFQAYGDSLVVSHAPRLE